MMRHECASRPEGSVLILALWTLLLLSFIVAALGSHVSTHMTAALDLSNRSICYFASRAGVETAVAAIRSATNEWADVSHALNKNLQTMKDVAVGDGVFTVFHNTRDDAGVVHTNYGVADEDGRVNINEVTNAAVYDLAKSLIRTAGGVGEEKAEGIVACIADWIDDDDQPRDGGAENSYYKGRSQPYSCHNGRLDCLEELLLIKGMDTNILAGIADHITLYGTNRGVNINTADPVVLRALAKMRKNTQDADADGFVKRVLEFRDGGGILSQLDKRAIRTLLFGSGDLSASGQGEWVVLEWLLNHRLIAVQSRHFCGISAGRALRGNAAERRIGFVFDSVTGEMEAWHEE